MTLAYRVEPLTDFTIFKHADWTTRRGVGFTAKWTQTLKDLERELDHLGATDVVVEIAVRPGSVRKDGMLYANAKVDHPGVRLSFETREHGRMSFTCDTYEARWVSSMPNWQANVRAIVLTLKSLRDVGRHGATQGEEYAGFKALPSGSGDGIALGAMTRDSALQTLASAAGMSTSSDLPDVTVARRLQNVYRRARARAHPDAATGSREAWDRVEQAANVLGLS